MNHPWRNVGASSVAIALILGGGGPAFADTTDTSEAPIQDWTSLSAEVQKLYDYRTSKGLTNGQDWQQTCSTFGEFHSSEGAQMFIDDNDEDLNSTSVIRFQNARSETMYQDGHTYNMFVVDLAECDTPAPAPTTAPTYVDNPGKNNDYIVLPEGYSFNDSNDEMIVLPSGNWKIPESYYVDGVANVSIELSTTNVKGNVYYEINPNTQHEWTYTFDGRTPVDISGEPTVSDGKFADDTFTVPASSGYSWHLSSPSGTVLSPGTYKVSDYAEYIDGDATVSLYPVVADSKNYVLSDDTVRTLSARNYETASVATPTQSDGYLNDDHLTLPEVEGADWYVNSKIVEPGTYSLDELGLYDESGDANYSVHLEAREGYRFDGKDFGDYGGSWVFTAKSYETISVPSITVNDGDGPQNDYFVLPDITGVAYEDASTNTALTPGKHYATGHIDLYITTTTGFKFDDMTQSKTYSNYLEPTYLAGTVVAPVFTDVAGNADTFTITKAAGIVWTVNGKVVDAGTHKVSEFMSGVADSQSIEINYTMSDGYRLRDKTPTGPWTHTFDTRIVIPETSPTFVDNDGPEDVVSIPETTGLMWYVNSKQVQPGDTVATGNVVVAAYASTGYVMSNGEGVEYWNKTLDSTYVSGVPAAPTVTDKPGTTKDELVLDNADGIVWTVNGEKVTPRTYKVSDLAEYSNGTADLVINASPADGFHLSDKVKTTSWSFSVSESSPVKSPSAPTWNSSTVTIPSQTGVAYYYNGKAVSGTIPAVTYGTMTIEARAVYGYEFSDPKATTSWSHDYDQRPRAAVKSPVSTSTGSGLSITFPVIDGVEWTVNGKTVSGTVEYGANSGTVSVKAVAKSGYVLTGTTTYTFDTTVDLSNNGSNQSGDENDSTIDETTGSVSTDTTGSVGTTETTDTTGGTVNELRKTGSDIAGTASMGIILLGAGVALLSVRRSAKSKR